MDSNVLAFDSFMGQVSHVLDNLSCTQEFIDYVKWVEETYVSKNKEIKKENDALKMKLIVTESEIVDKDRQLSYLKLQINKARMEKVNVVKERDNLRNKLKQVTNLILDDSSGHLEEQTRASINRITSTVDLNTPIVYSGNHSIFSELSFSTETVDEISDELLSEESFLLQKRKPRTVNTKNKATAHPISSILKSKRVAPSTSLETSEEEFHSLGETNSSPRCKMPRVCFATESIHKRPHTFDKYKSLIPHRCRVCSKLMSFQSESSKCDVCKTVTHQTCQSELPLPCVPAPSTPVHLHKTITGKISAYTPFVPPMIPGLIIHCINAVEKTGLNQECIYKYEGHSAQVKELLKELTSEKKTGLELLLQRSSIHSVCSTLKEFFLSLDEHLLPADRWEFFQKSLEDEDARDVESRLIAGIAELPQPNRDTLAYTVLHLQRVADSEATKMTKRDLAQIFGPIIVGTDNGIDTTANSKPARVLEHLLNLSADYWNNFIVVAGPVTPTMQDLRNTPTSVVALTQTINRRGLTTPYRTFTRSEQKKKYFKTPMF